MFEQLKKLLSNKNNNVNNFDLLPIEMQLQIFNFLTGKDRLTASRVDGLWYKLNAETGRLEAGAEKLTHAYAKSNSPESQSLYSRLAFWNTTPKKPIDPAAIIRSIQASNDSNKLNAVLDISIDGSKQDRGYINKVLKTLVTLDNVKMELETFLNKYELDENSLIEALQVALTGNKPGNASVILERMDSNSIVKFSNDSSNFELVDYLAQNPTQEWKTFFDTLRENGMDEATLARLIPDAYNYYPPQRQMIYLDR